MTETLPELEEMETRTVQCQICAQSLTVNMPKRALDAFPRGFWDKLMAATVHEACARLEASWKQRAAEDVLAARAMERWEMLAPPLYQGTEAWLEAGGRLNREAFDKALAWDGRLSGLILHGERSGTGKTSAAWLLLRRLMASGGTALAYSHSDFSRKATWMARENDPASHRWVRLVVAADFLLVDDFGQSRFKTADGTSKAAEELLFDVVDARIAKGRKTILTTNDTSGILRGKLSEQRATPFIRRLQEHFSHVNFG
jgi:DNA replication protein DnaC